MTSPAAPVDLPIALRRRARRLGGELAWRPEAARDVIAWLADNDVAMLGVELWRERDGHPEWHATSDYRFDHGSAGDHAAAARAFVDRFEGEPGALFNLTWSSRGDVSTL